MSPSHLPYSLPMLFLTQDLELFRQVEVYLEGRCRLRQFDEAVHLESHLRTTGHVVTLLDLRCRGGLDVCRNLAHHRQDIEWIVLGTPTSVPLLEAESIGVFGREDLPLDKCRFQALTVRAQRQLALQIENASLRSECAQRQTSAQPPPPNYGAGASASQPLGTFSRSLRRIQSLANLMESIVESVASSCMISRVGVFARTPTEDRYRLHAGLRCLEATRNTRYEPTDALVRWLEINACQVVRGHLPHVESIHDRILLQHELDAMGAEIILPLQGRNRLWGWLFVGQRGTGLPFSYAELEQLLVMADHISTTLENAFLYEEAALQKTMAETLLHSIPSGIVSIHPDGTVASVNSAAETLLDLTHEQARKRPVAVLGSRLADVLLRALDGETTAVPSEWVDPHSRRALAVETRQLIDNGHCLGAVAFVQDLTQQRLLKEKEEQIERITFYSDLAAHMSHEVRNPLQAINTFAQLLPERYDDAEFRAEFSRVVTSEVDRLNGIVARISSFAEPPNLKFATLRIEEVITAAIHRAQSSEPYTTVPIRFVCEDDLPSVSGDAKALTDCFAQVIMNACEATYDRGDPVIRLRATLADRPDQSATLQVAVQDNGPGIPTDLMEKIFSPFCTSKPHRLGLGLPIAKRTVMDHGGAIDIEPGPDGARIVISLPVCRQEVPVP